jgi:hypothetical protein
MVKASLVLAALVAVAGVASNASAQELAKDQAYCRQLVDEYTQGGLGNGPWSQSLDMSVAIDQCRSGNPEPAIPVLQERLRDAGFDVPARS